MLGNLISSDLENELNFSLCIKLSNNNSKSWLFFDFCNFKNVCRNNGLRKDTNP